MAQQEPHQKGPQGSPKSKKSRWGPSTPSSLITLPTAINAPMTAEQLDAYTLHLRIQEITQTLQTDTVLRSNHTRSRSPSPPPEYDASGKRTNSRHARHHLRLERERHALIQQAIQLIPGYRALAQYHTAHRGRSHIAKRQEEVYITARDFPEVNFIGQILGPRGRSLTDMCTQSGANIVIRGKGSVKEGKGTRQASRQHSDAHEPGNERKTGQLRDLAVLNGTFRDIERRETMGGELGGGGSLSRVICRVCGGGGHIARDCGMRKRGCAVAESAVEEGRREANPAEEWGG
ncbi:hypothetical protein QBC34DRAFT_487235 [Podospora aff. communis PSN243]|uniref:Branchpoint-bridging protein n=1 Tax=Podospora aff. communis PSN243 TaxID=3040156 RepID=A0AAV9GEL7_9PEZI|nr:hypothetical protein QBC34DRAFT_487235 [Podospora aff. communis PSN243]